MDLSAAPLGIALTGLHAWAVLMWRGTILRDRLERAAAKWTWNTPKMSVKPFTVGIVPIVLFFDYIPVSIAIHRAAGIPQGQDPIDLVIAAPSLVTLVLWLIGTGWDTPMWMFPPWYRVWVRRRQAHGSDASHEISVVCAHEKPDGSAPFLYAQCECDWLSTIVSVKDDDYAAALRHVLMDAQGHSRNLKRSIEFPQGRPAAAPATLP